MTTAAATRGSMGPGVERPPRLAHPRLRPDSPTSEEPGHRSLHEVRHDLNRKLTVESADVVPSRMTNNHRLVGPGDGGLCPCVVKTLPAPAAELTSDSGDARTDFQ